MKNAEKFRKIFKEFATEVWAFPEKDFLAWLNAEYEEPTTKNDLGVDCISRERLKQIVFNITAEYDTETIHIDRLIDEIDNLPSVTPQLSVPEVTALAEWTEKLTKASEDAYNKGYADGMKAQDTRKGHWIADVDRWGNVVTTVNGYKCDKCNAFNSDKDNYCPNCGADMREIEV